MRSLLLTFILQFFFTSPTLAVLSDSDKYLNAHITHAFYTAILESYFTEGDKKYRAPYLANKRYFQVFLKRWNEHIEKGSLSSAQIFRIIQSEGGYLGKYYSVWDNLVRSRPATIRIGGVKNQALAAILRSESEAASLEDRLLRLLSITRFYVLVNSGDYDLATLLTAPFLKSENRQIRETAASLIADIPFQKKIEILTWVRNMAIPLRWALAPTVAKVGSIINPFLSRVPPMYTATAVSTLGHAGGLAFLDERFKNTTTTDEKEFYDPLTFSLGVLWSAIENSRNPSDLYWESNFVVQFKSIREQEMVARISAHLKNPQRNPLDYFSTFLQAEKIKNLDQRANTDLIAMDYMSGQVEKFKEHIRKLAKDGMSEVEVKEFRKIAIENFLRRYKRDYPQLTSLLLGWGGSCVSQTLFIIGMLQDVSDRIEKKRLGVVLFTDHMEAVLYDEKFVELLANGYKIPRQGARIFKPEYLLHVLLRGFEADKDTPDSAFIVGPHRAIKQTEKPTRDRQGGILDNVGNINSWDGPLSYFGAGDPPEEGELEFSDTVVSGSGAGLGFQLTEVTAAEDEVEWKIKIKLKPTVLLDKDTKIPFVGNYHYDSSEKVATAFDEKSYFKLLREAGRVRNYESLVNFQQFIQEDLVTNLRSLLESEEAHRLLLHPAEEISVFKQWTARDAIAATQMRIRIAVAAEQAMFTKLYEVAYEEQIGNIEIFDRLRAHLSDEAAFLPELYEKYKQAENLIFKQIARDPKKFVEICNQLGPSVRSYVMDTLFEYFFQDHERLKKMVEHRLYSYMSSLSKIRVLVSRKDCLPYDNTLPVSQFPLGPQYQRTNPNCDGGYEMILVRNPGQGMVTAPTSLNITLKLNVLVELTAFAGAGLHLWDENLVELFLSDSFGETIIPRQALRDAIMLMAKFNPPDNPHPALRRLVEP